MCIYVYIYIFMSCDIIPTYTSFILNITDENIFKIIENNTAFPSPQTHTHQEVVQGDR